MTRLFFHNIHFTFLFVSLVLSSQCFAFANNPLDSIPPYEGIRVHLTNVQLVKSKKTKAKIKYDIVNTGRQAIFSNRTTPLSKALVIEFEDALKNCNCQLAQFQDAIRYQFYYQKINLLVGKSIKNQTMDITITQAAPPPLVIYHPRKDKTKNKIEVAKIKVLTEEKYSDSNPTAAANEKELKTKTPKISIQKNNTSAKIINHSNKKLPKAIAKKKEEQLIKEETIANNKNKEIPDERIVDNTIPTSTKQNNSFTLKKEKKRKKKKSKKKQKEETLIVTEMDQMTNVDKETLEKDPSIEVESTPAQEAIAVEEMPTQVVDTQSTSLKNIISSVAGTTTKTTATIISNTNRSSEIGNNSSSFVRKKEELAKKGIDTKLEIAADKMECSDLVLTNVKILKQSKNFVTLEYTIHNSGGQAAKIQNEAKTSGQVFAIKAFLSTSNKLTRGALPLGGGFIEKLDKDKNGFLASNGSYTGKIKLEIRKKTRFTPNLILSLDPYLAIKECDRTNNTGHVVLKDK